MDLGISAVVVGLVTALGGIIVACIQTGRRENKEDHALVADSLRQLHLEVHRVGNKVDRHVQWHVEGTRDGTVKPTTHRDREEA